MPARDARRSATDKTFRKLLDLNASSRREARTDAEVEAVFSPLWKAVAAFTRRVGPNGNPAPDVPGANGTAGGTSTP